MARRLTAEEVRLNDAARLLHTHVYSVPEPPSFTNAQLDKVRTMRKLALQAARRWGELYRRRRPAVVQNSNRFWEEAGYLFYSEYSGLSTSRYAIVSSTINKPIPELIEELRAVEAAMGNPVVVTEDPIFVHFRVTTPPVTLRLDPAQYSLDGPLEFPMGAFEITNTFYKATRTWNPPTARALTPYPARDGPYPDGALRGGLVHPNVNGTNFCLGNAAVIPALTAGNLATAAILFQQVLDNGAQSERPFYPLHNWYGEAHRCRCDKVVSKRQIRELNGYCEYCGLVFRCPMCPPQPLSCFVCGDATQAPLRCPNCHPRTRSYSCRVCSRPTCARHHRYCLGCSTGTCPEHAETPCRCSPDHPDHDD